jgi:hypothetical protein
MSNVSSPMRRNPHREADPVVRALRYARPRLGAEGVGAFAELGRGDQGQQQRNRDADTRQLLARYCAEHIDR